MWLSNFVGFMILAPELGNLSQLGGSVTNLLSNSCIMFHFVSSIMFLKVCNFIWARLWSYELDEGNLNLDINEGLHRPLKLGKSDRYPVTSSTTLSPLSPYSQPSSAQPGNTRTASPQQEESRVINLFWAWARQEEEGEATEFASEDVCVCDFHDQ